MEDISLYWIMVDFGDFAVSLMAEYWKVSLIAISIGLIYFIFKLLYWIFKNFTPLGRIL